MAVHAPALAAATAHLSRGRTTEALDLLKRHLHSFPKDDEAQWLVGTTLFRLRMFDQAVYFLERSAHARPHDAERWTLFAEALWFGSAGPKRAETILRSCAPVRDGDDTALALLAGVLEANGRTGESVAILRQVLSGHPHRLKALGALGRQLALAGHTDEALEHLAHAATSANPLDIAQLCFFLNHSSAPTPAQVFGHHKRLQRLLENDLPLAPAPQPGPWPDRPVRLAFLSAEMRHHSVAYFFEPLLEHLDRAAFHITVFSATRQEDEVSARLRSKTDAWCNVPADDLAALAPLVRRERPDILVDLGGLTSGTWALAMAPRLAPLQGTYLGYPNTTGVPNIDRRLVDALTDPVEPFDDGTRSDGLATERLARLEGCFLCYRPDDHAPQVATRPGADPVVFGSFNASAKISPACIRLWAGVLERVRGSRLLLKAAAFEDRWVCEQFRRSFRSAGVNPSRLDLRPQTRTAQDHLRTYSEVDIALDTYPYHGTTTTCEAMWMGVPVVTLVGRSHASRVGLSLLHAAGVPENALTTPDAFAQRAADLAADRASLADLRAGLRDRVKGSVLCDGPGFARRFAVALRAWWGEAALRS
jgi:protein O-GlcNAc transferase